MNDKLQQKLVDLETSWGLLQHDVEQQNDEIIRLSRRLRHLEDTVQRLRDQLQSLQASSGTESLPEDERPPHY